MTVSIERPKDASNIYAKRKDSAVRRNRPPHSRAGWCPKEGREQTWTDQAFERKDGPMMGQTGTLTRPSENQSLQFDPKHLPPKRDRTEDLGTRYRRRTLKL